MQFPQSCQQCKDAESSPHSTCVLHSTYAASTASPRGLTTPGKKLPNLEGQHLVGKAVGMAINRGTCQDNIGNIEISD